MEWTASDVLLERLRCFPDRVLRKLQSAVLELKADRIRLAG